MNVAQDEILFVITAIPETEIASKHDAVTTFSVLVESDALMFTFHSF